MATAEPDENVLPQLIEELKDRVARRRAAGEYPEGLEEALDSHFQRISERIPTHYDQGRLRAALGKLEADMGFNPDRIPIESGMPGGSAIHKAVAKAVSRQTQGILEQTQVFADAVRDAVKELIEAFEHPHGHEHADLLGQVDALFDRLAALERAPADSAAAVADLRVRVEALEQLSYRHRFDPWFSNSDFEEAFRGNADELRVRYSGLADRVAGAASVVDIGCGRGEWIELLQARGCRASGVEIDPQLVSEARARGLDVVEGDAVGWMRAQADRSLDAVTMIQVIEHLAPQEVLDFVELAARKIRRDGWLVIETVNPQSLYVYAHPFYLDPTHTQPIHPAYLMFLLEKIGFKHLEIDWRSPPPEPDVLEELPDDADRSAVHNRNAARLNQLLFAPQDYAVIARR